MKLTITLEESDFEKAAGDIVDFHHDWCGSVACNCLEVAARFEAAIEEAREKAKMLRKKMSEQAWQMRWDAIAESLSFGITPEKIAADLGLKPSSIARQARTFGYSDIASTFEKARHRVHPPRTNSRLRAKK